MSEERIVSIIRDFVEEVMKQYVDATPTMHQDCINFFAHQRPILPAALAFFWLFFGLISRPIGQASRHTVHST